MTYFINDVTINDFLFCDVIKNRFFLIFWARDLKIGVRVHFNMLSSILKTGSENLLPFGRYWPLKSAILDFSKLSYRLEIWYLSTFWHAEFNFENRKWKSTSVWPVLPVKVSHLGFFLKLSQRLEIWYICTFWDAEFNSGKQKWKSTSVWPLLSVKAAILDFSKLSYRLKI